MLTTQANNSSILCSCGIAIKKSHRRLLLLLSCSATCFERKTGSGG